MTLIGNGHTRIPNDKRFCIKTICEVGKDYDLHDMGLYCFHKECIRKKKYDLLTCKECGGEVMYFEHSDVMETFEVDGYGDKKVCVDKEFTGRLIEQYGECIECSQIYACDPETARVNLDQPLDKYPTDGTDIEL